MELKEAFDIIDATLGMFRTFAGEIENGDLKEKFLMTPVYTSVENVYDANKYDVKIEVRSYYNYVEGDKEYKRYIVDIRPICSYLVNEWPSYKAKRIRKKLIAVTSECANYCETYLGGIADVAEDDGFSYDRYVRTQDSCDIETVMLDTIHEMCHALRLTEDEEHVIQDNHKTIPQMITKEDARQINWVEKTQNFDLDAIKDIVENMGNTPREKQIIIQAIYDAETDTGEAYKIPYSVDKLLNDLYKNKKYDEKHKGFLKAYDPRREGLNLDILMEQKFEELIQKNTAMDADIDEIFETPAALKIEAGKSDSTVYDKLPKDFKTSEAEQLMQKLVNAGLLNNNWKPVNLSIAERGYLADEITNRLNINYKWKVMGELWNENPGTLRKGKNNAIEQKKTGAFIEKLKNVLG